METNESANTDVEMGGMESHTPIPAQFFGSKTLQDHEFFFSDASHRINLSVLVASDFKDAERMKAFAIEPLDTEGDWEIVRPTDFTINEDTKAEPYDKFCRYYTNAYITIDGRHRVVLPVWRIRVSDIRTTPKTPWGFLDVVASGNKAGIHDIVIDRVGRLHDVCRASFVSPESTVHTSQIMVGQGGFSKNIIPPPQETDFYQTFFHLDKSEQKRLAVAPPAITVRDVYEPGSPPKNQSSSDKHWPTATWRSDFKLTRGTANQKSHILQLRLPVPKQKLIKPCQPKTSTKSKLANLFRGKKRKSSQEDDEDMGDAEQLKGTENPFAVKGEEVPGVKIEEVMDFEMERPMLDASVEDEVFVLNPSTGKWTTVASRQQSRSQKKHSVPPRTSSLARGLVGYTSSISRAADVEPSGITSRSSSRQVVKSEYKQEEITKYTQTTRPLSATSAPASSFSDHLIKKEKATSPSPLHYTQATTSTSLFLKSPKDDFISPGARSIPSKSVTMKPDLRMPSNYAKGREYNKQRGSPKWAKEERVVKESDSDSDE